jgi:hypothetical protein
MLCNTGASILLAFVMELRAMIKQSLKLAIAKIAAEIIPKGGREKFAKSLDMSPSQLSRFLNHGSYLRDERILKIAEKLQILEEAHARAQAAGRYRVAYCPSPHCMGATLYIEDAGLYILPSFHSPVREYCPFCHQQRLRSRCIGEKEDGQDCDASIRAGARSCVDCGFPYVVTPDSYEFEEIADLQRFVADEMAKRREARREYADRYGIKPDEQIR